MRRYKPDSIKVARYVFGIVASVVFVGVGIFFLASGQATGISKGSSFSHSIRMDGSDARIYGVIIVVFGLVFLTLSGIRLKAELTGKEVPELTDESDHYW